MKKLLALVLAAMMLLSAGSVLAESNYKEKIAWDTTFPYQDTSTDYMADDLAKWVQETFNTEIEVIYTATNGYDEVVRTMIYGGTMPTCVTWHNNQTEYMDYIEQGLIAPLPETWKTDYPDLYRMVQKTGLEQFLEVDGLTYGIPHAAYCNFMDIPAPIPNTILHYYRKDWAEQLGFDWSDKVAVTLDEMKAFCEAAVAADMAGNGNTIGFTGSTTDIVKSFMTLNGGVRYTSFARDEENQQYVWNPAANTAVIVEQIEKLREWYNAGLIDPDFYLTSSSEAQSKVSSGLAAVTVYGGHVHGFREFDTAFTAANPDKSFKDVIGTFVLTSEDGTLYTEEVTNHYTYSIFNPDIDEATLRRILEIMDFFCTKEGSYWYGCGVKGQDWDFEADGSVLTGTDYKSNLLWGFISIVSDDFSFGNPALDADWRARALEQMIYKSENGVAVLYPFEYGFHSSEAKNNYSADVQSKIVELAMNDADIATEWAAYLEQFSGMVEPLLDELNATYFGK